MIYSVNYRYVVGIIAGDGAEQDVFIFGTEELIDHFEGKVIAVYHRFNDVEDKWIVSVDGKDYSDDEILARIAFQEQYFYGVLCRMRDRCISGNSTGNYISGCNEKGYCL